MIIGICGKKGVGKDTLANYYAEKYGIALMTLAEPLKKFVGEVFRFEKEQLFGDKKEVIDPRYGVTPREVLQIFGTEIFQFDIHERLPNLKTPKRKFWILRLKQVYDETKEKIGGNPSMCVTDIRFKHEAEVIKDMGGYVIKVERNIKNEDQHPSEKEVEEIEADFVIHNDGTTKEMYLLADKIISKIYGICCGKRIKP